jgi:hypothetical protein
MMDSYVEYIVISARIAEARREGERAQLLARATQPAARRRSWHLMQHIGEALSRLWLKGCSEQERMADR